MFANKSEIHPFHKANVLFPRLQINVYLHIHDITGRLVLKSSNQPSIDVSELEGGIYFLKLGSKTLSFIKN